MSVGLVTGDNNFDHLAKVVSARFFYVKLISPSFNQ